MTAASAHGAAPRVVIRVKAARRRWWSSLSGGWFAMERLRSLYAIAVVARWAGWLIALGLIGRAGAFTAPGQHLFLLSLGVVVTAGMLLWTQVARRWIAQIADGTVMVLYDLGVSLAPVVFSGGWRSPFLPLALSTLVAPTVSRGLRLGLPLATLLALVNLCHFLLTDALQRAVTALAYGSAPPAWSAVLRELALLAGWSALPFGVVLITTWSTLLLRHSQERGRHHAGMSRVPRVERASPARRHEALPLYHRAAPDAPAPRPWTRERGSQPAVARRSAASIEATLRAYRAELEAAGVALVVELEPNPDQQLTPHARELLSRALEIALDNVLSHAHARQVTVALHRLDGALCLRVIDDGVGLFDGTAEPPGFHQLKRLRFRVQELGGLLWVDEHERGGVVFELRLPFGGSAWRGDHPDAV